MHNNSSLITQSGQRAAFWAEFYAVLCLVCSLIGAGFFDRLTGVLSILSTFLFYIVCRYSKRYLMGDPGQGRFMFWLCMTGSFVFALILSQNLLLFSLAWCGISLSLHQLLQFYRDRQPALLAARKKFIISRLGDTALLGALVLTYREFGTWDFQSIFIAAERLRAAGLANVPLSVNLVCGLLVFAALLKSAQFPFHSWLPDTMETPTPVSALMHAGIINAGGILIIRLSPLISLSDSAMRALCLVGGFTALFASIVMLTQASIKRCLAFSTVAQMGFMMLECGLGAFHLALLHLAAHSFYKAYAFLSSGSVVLRGFERSQFSISPIAVLSCILAAFAINFSIATWMGVAPLEQFALNGIFSLALAQMLWSLWTQVTEPWRLPLSVVVGGVLSAIYFALDRVAELVVSSAQSNTHWYGLTILLLFIIISVIQSQLPLFVGTPLGRRIYVHARNGFYFNTLANRLTTALWPVKVSQGGN